MLKMVRVLSSSQFLWCWRWSVSCLVPSSCDAEDGLCLNCLTAHWCDQQSTGRKDWRGEEVTTEVKRLTGRRGDNRSEKLTERGGDNRSEMLMGRGGDNRSEKLMGRGGDNRSEKIDGKRGWQQKWTEETMISGRRIKRRERRIPWSLMVKENTRDNEGALFVVQCTMSA